MSLIGRNTLEFFSDNPNAFTLPFSVSNNWLNRHQIDARNQGQSQPVSACLMDEISVAVNSHLDL